MKIKIALFCATCVALLANTAPAVINMTLEEVGSDVVLTASGSVNLDSGTMTLLEYNIPTKNSIAPNITGVVTPNRGMLGGGSGNADIYGDNLLTQSFGPGGEVAADSTTGDALGIFDYTSSMPAIVVPTGYVSNTPIARPQQLLKTRP